MNKDCHWVGVGISVETKGVSYIEEPPSKANTICQGIKIVLDKVKRDCDESYKNIGIDQWATDRWEYIVFPKLWQ